jgi:hypothetical protein
LKDTNNEERYALLELQHQLLLVGMGDRTATKGVDQNIPHPSPQMKIFIHTNHALSNITMNIQQRNIYDKKKIIIIIKKKKPMLSMPYRNLDCSKLLPHATNSIGLPASKQIG